MIRNVSDVKPRETHLAACSDPLGQTEDDDHADQGHQP